MSRQETVRQLVSRILGWWPEHPGNGRYQATSNPAQLVVCHDAADRSPRRNKQDGHGADPKQSV